MEFLKSSSHINIKGYSIHYEYKLTPSASKPPIFFLHGFTGRGEDWNNIISQLQPDTDYITLDFIGHGFSSSPEEVKYYSTDSIIESLLSILKKLCIESVILAGYSMGGRAALSFANKYPEYISGMIIESSTPGIKDRAERELRYKNDLELCKKIKTHGITNFIDFWMNIPLFDTLKSLPQDKYQALVKNKYNNSDMGLINLLKGFSTGIMPHLWDSLNKFNFPTLLLCGTKDSKFRDINLKMNNLLPKSELEVIPSCGHNIHVENEKVFLKKVNCFLRNHHL